MIKPFYLFGLGNPGKEYTHSRHNAGHLLIDFLQKEKIEGLRLFKNRQVGMNTAGEEVAELVEREKVPLDRLFIIHDDMDIKVGALKLQKGRGSAGHKGVESVITALGTKDFWRLRVGIGRPQDGSDLRGFVLDDFTRAELESFELLAPLVIEKLRQVPKII